MRTALLLLFALALAAIPGSLLPQRSLSPIRVRDFVKQHRTVGPLYDKVGLFHVYTSAWFSAIYLLLFISLVGCIVPRIGVYAKALRRPPPRAPRNLSRLPAYARAESEGGEQVLRRAAGRLSRQRYRVVIDSDTVAAERGFLREAGNLVFHVSVLVLLLGVAVSTLYGFRGYAVVIVGQGFSNNLTQYDDISAGAWFSEKDLNPFTVTVKDFDAKFETGPVQRGAARLFRADLEVIDTPSGKPYDQRLEVNKPLKIGDNTVYLIGHGYAPKVTVRDGNGDVAFSGPVVFLPQDGSFTSAGVINAPDARPNRLAFEGIFTPTSVRDRGPQSVFPDALLPALYVNAWSGPPAVETGTPESVYTLNRTGLTQLKNPDGSAVAVRLVPGDVFTLPDAEGTIQMDGWTRWVKLQIGDSPGTSLIFGAIAFAIGGLCLSLFVRPRRVWVRVSHRDGGPVLFEVAGLDRADARTGLAEDVQQLTSALSGTQESKEVDP
jgi:cytochrome c biogenesis protein